MNLTQATKLYLQAKAELEVAEKAKKTAEVAMKQAFAQTGINYNVVNGKKVTVTSKARRSVDADKLGELVNPTIFEKVTKVVVDMKHFDAAITAGVLKQDVADIATKVTEYDEVRVTDLANETEGIATIKVA